ncbi:Bifunctional pinoresinol-lariciresinol reductase [Arachis hypogaea]|nr:Bifunctional pinoresinol-lariciresinol reductase [Arachis hypogaea]
MHSIVYHKTKKAREMLKSKVLIVGGIGKRLVKASLDEGHETYVLCRKFSFFCHSRNKVLTL